jgi:flagellar biosynthesis protein FlhF
MGELAVLRTQIDELRRSVARSANNYPAWLPPTSPLAERYATLISQELEAPLAQQIVLNVHTRLTRPVPRGGDGERGDLDAMLRAELQQLIATDSNLPAGKNGPPVIALVGPPGAGKTATLAKLAVRYGLGAGRATQILSVDTYRVGAAEQLRVYSGLLGVAFRAVESVRELGHAIEECRQKQLILIDTPGYGFGDFEYASELAGFFADRDEIQTHLALPASMKPLDMARVANRFEAFCPSRLIFSRLDETASYGPLLGMAVVTGKPVSFLTAGQRIPEDLAAASPDRLAEMILPQRQATSVLSAA